MLNSESDNVTLANILQLFDEYTLRARLQPALIVATPIAISAIAWLPVDSIQNLRVSVPISLLGLMGFAALFAQLGRDEGKRKEARLFETWGGKPTTRMLRHRDVTLNPVVRARYHSQLGSIAGMPRIPTESDERADPAGADQVYDACASYLRDTTRDRQLFPLVFQENANYGFRRNLWGMRAAGVVVAAVACAICMLGAAMRWVDHDTIDFGSASSASLNAVLLAWWLVRISPDWVRTTADAYSLRLLETCDRLRVEESPYLVGGRDSSHG